MGYDPNGEEVVCEATTRGFDSLHAHMTRALIVVDVQNDFCTGGSLAVAGGSNIAQRIANSMMFYGTEGKSPRYSHMVATKDWHLSHHSNLGHFDEWPQHCVMGTEGAQFHPAIAEHMEKFDAIFYKGMGVPAYSGFEGSFERYPNEFVFLDDFLKGNGVTDLDIVGIATDVCVRATAFDAIRLGYRVRVPLQLTVAVGGPEVAGRVIQEIYDAQGIETRIN